jgi:excisionase family DNA binding protein
MAAVQVEDDAVWSLAETARHFVCSTKTVQMLCREQGLPFFMIGRLWRFRRSDVLAWQAAQIEASKAVA